MSDTNIPKDKEVIVTEKKKQKAGLSAVRPDNDIEDNFKNMAKDKNLTQTKLFENMFWDYIRDGREAKRENAISFDGELGLISIHLESILIYFKTIATKSQDTVISLKSNTEQIEKNLKLEIETLNLKLVELTNRNTELENTNKIFNEIREGLEAKILKLSDTALLRETENKKILEDIKGKDNEIKSNKKTIELIEKDKKELATVNATLLENIILKDSKLGNLESTNVSVQNTVNSMESFRKSEISSIEARYQTEITALNSKINGYDADKEKELKRIKASMKSEYESDKKMALAEVILQLADMKGKYAEHQGNYNELQSKLKVQQSNYNELQRKFNEVSKGKTKTQ